MPLIVSQEAGEVHWQQVTCSEKQSGSGGNRFWQVSEDTWGWNRWNSKGLWNKYPAFQSEIGNRFMWRFLPTGGEGALLLWSRNPSRCLLWRSTKSCRNTLSISQGETYISYLPLLGSAGEGWPRHVDAEGGSCSDPPGLHSCFSQGKHWVQHRNIHWHLGRRAHLAQILRAASRLITHLIDVCRSGSGYDKFSVNLH